MLYSFYLHEMIKNSLNDFNLLFQVLITATYFKYKHTLTYMHSDIQTIIYLIKMKSVGIVQLMSRYGYVTEKSQCRTQQLKSVVTVINDQHVIMHVYSHVVWIV